MKLWPEIRVADLLVKHDLVVQTRGGPALNKGIDAPRKAGAFRRTTLLRRGMRTA